ncbi:toll/interleukin-1 receptor domain-containing protein [Pseudomonas sp. 210_17 TE3656]
MSDVFISYASENRKHAQWLATALVNQRYTVWWDRELLAGGVPYGDVIEHELTLAKRVIVLWSEHAKRSIWVRSEATKALDKVVSVRIDDVTPPLPFDALQIIDLSDWRGEEGDASFQQLCRALGSKVAPPEVSWIRSLLKFVRRYRVLFSMLGLAVVVYLGVLLYPFIVVADLYTHPGGSFERKGGVWVEYPEYAPGHNFTFSSAGYDPSYLYLYDSSRHQPGDSTRVFYMRLPLRGGMAQWSYPNPFNWQDLYRITPGSPR